MIWCNNNNNSNATTWSLYKKHMKEHMDKGMFPLGHSFLRSTWTRGDSSSELLPPRDIHHVLISPHKHKLASTYFFKHCQRHNGPMGWHHNWRHLIASKFSKRDGTTCICWKFSHMLAKFLTNASGATWWLNFKQMHVVPSVYVY